MHGEDDDSVPVSDARQLVNVHGNAELSLFAGAGHRLRHDPRAVAVLSAGSIGCGPFSCTRAPSGSELGSQVVAPPVGADHPCLGLLPDAVTGAVTVVPSVPSGRD